MKLERATEGIREGQRCVPMPVSMVELLMAILTSDDVPEENRDHFGRIAERLHDCVLENGLGPKKLCSVRSL